MTLFQTTFITKYSAHRKDKAYAASTCEIKREDLYCSKKGRCTQHLAQEFCLRWSKEYLQQLQAKTKWAR